MFCTCLEVAWNDLALADRAFGARGRSAPEFTPVITGGRRLAWPNDDVRPIRVGMLLLAVVLGWGSIYYCLCHAAIHRSTVSREVVLPQPF